MVLEITKHSRGICGTWRSRNIVEAFVVLEITKHSRGICGTGDHEN